ncbi:hypothetical protein [Thermococcus sp.]
MHAGMGLGALGLLGVLVFLVALFIAAIFLYLGAKLVGIEEATFGRSVIAVLGGGILALLLAVVPVIGKLLSVIGYIWVIKVVFNTSWLRAFLAWIMTMVVTIVAVLVLGAIVGLSLLAAL